MALCRWPDHYPPITNHVRRIYKGDQSDSSLELRNRALSGDKVQVFSEYEWIIYKQNKNEMNTKKQNHTSKPLRK